MVSLAYSLYEFGHGGGTESVVTNFGIALTTTIIGLTGRVFFQQLREDPFDVEREVQADLNEAARAFRFQLLAAVSDMNGLRLAVTQSVSEATTTASKASVDAISAVTKSFQGAVTDLVDALRKSDESLREQQDATRSSVKRVGSVIERLADRLDGLEVPSAALKGRLDALADSFVLLLRALEARTTKEKGDGEALEELRKGTRTVAETLKVELEALSASTASHRMGVQAALTALTEGADSLRTTAESAIKHSEETAAAQQKLHEALLTSSREALASVQQLRQDLTAAVKDSSGMVNKVHSSLVSMTHLLTDELGAKRNRA
jgi:chromosome segregation ATPase